MSNARLRSARVAAIQADDSQPESGHVARRGAWWRSRGGLAPPLVARAGGGLWHHVRVRTEAEEAVGALRRRRRHGCVRRLYPGSRHPARVRLFVDPRGANVSPPLTSAADRRPSRPPSRPFLGDGPEVYLSEVYMPRGEYYFKPPAFVQRFLERTLNDTRDMEIAWLYWNIVTTMYPALIALFTVLPPSNILGAAYLVVFNVLYLQRFILAMHYSTHRRLFKKELARTMSTVQHRARRAGVRHPATRTGCTTSMHHGQQRVEQRFERDGGVPAG